MFTGSVSRVAKNGDFGTISMEVKDRLTKTKLYFYRQALQAPHRNDQTPR